MSSVGSASYSISTIGDSEALNEFESQSDYKTELANLDISNRTLKVSLKIPPLDIELVQNFPYGTKTLKNLPTS